MSQCACGDKAVTIETDKGRVVRLSVMQERLAMCATCMHGEHDGSFWSGGTDRCGISGRHVLDHAGDGLCPRGKFPDGERRVTRWAGVRWYGVPYPIRVMLWIVAPGHHRPSRWFACGCLKRAKDLWRLVRTALAAPAQERA